MKHHFATLTHRFSPREQEGKSMLHEAAMPTKPPSRLLAAQTPAGLGFIWVRMGTGVGADLASVMLNLRKKIIVNEGKQCFMYTKTNHSQKLGMLNAQKMIKKCHQCVLTLIGQKMFSELWIFNPLFTSDAYFRASRRCLLPALLQKQGAWLSGDLKVMTNPIRPYTKWGFCQKLVTAKACKLFCSRAFFLKRCTSKKINSKWLFLSLTISQSGSTLCSMKKDELIPAFNTHVLKTVKTFIKSGPFSMSRLINCAKIIFQFKIPKFIQFLNNDSDLQELQETMPEAEFQFDIPLTTQSEPVHSPWATKTPKGFSFWCPPKFFAFGCGLNGQTHWLLRMN